MKVTTPHTVAAKTVVARPSLLVANLPAGLLAAGVLALAVSSPSLVPVAVAGWVLARSVLDPGAYVVSYTALDGRSPVRSQFLGPCRSKGSLVVFTRVLLVVVVAGATLAAVFALGLVGLDLFGGSDLAGAPTADLAAFVVIGAIAAVAALSPLFVYQFADVAAALSHSRFGWGPFRTSATVVRTTVVHALAFDLVAVALGAGALAVLVGVVSVVGGVEAAALVPPGGSPLSTLGSLSGGDRSVVLVAVVVVATVHGALQRAARVAHVMAAVPPV